MWMGSGFEHKWSTSRANALSPSPYDLPGLSGQMGKPMCGCGKYILTVPVLLAVLRLVAEGGRKERAIALGLRDRKW